jgi:hypothetical protein
LHAQASEVHGRQTACLRGVHHRQGSRRSSQAASTAGTAGLPHLLNGPAPGGAASAIRVAIRVLRISLASLCPPLALLHSQAALHALHRQQQPQLVAHQPSGAPAALRGVSCPSASSGAATSSPLFFNRTMQLLAWSPEGEDASSKHSQ